jgi:hypothetical protein
MWAKNWSTLRTHIFYRQLCSILALAEVGQRFQVIGQVFSFTISTRAGGSLHWGQNERGISRYEGVSSFGAKIEGEIQATRGGVSSLGIK